MAEFRINVIVDPASAESKIDKVTNSLNEAEKANARLNKGLKNTFAIKTLTMAQGLDRIVKSLNNVNKAGANALKTLNKIKGFNASRVKITPQVTKQQKGLPELNPADFEKSISRVNKALDGATKRVDKLDKTLQRAFDIRTQSAIRNIKGVNTSLRAVENQGQRVGNVLKRAFAFLATGFAVREAANLADAYTNTQNRLKLVTKDTAELGAVTDELFKISDRTRSSFEATATIYSRTALATKELGLSQQETLNFVESLNQAIILSGVTSVEAANGLIQLSQGIASGTLRGDELRSVLEQLPAVADVISERLGITRGELRILGTEGKITGEIIIDAFAQASDSLKDRMGKTVPTLGQSFTILRSNVIKAIGEFDKANKVTATLSGVIITLARNLDTLGKVAVIVGSALAVGLAQRGILVVVTAVHALTAAIALNPIGALIIGIVAGVTALVQFSDEISLIGDGVTTLRDLFSVLWDVFVQDAKNAVAIIKGLGVFIIDALSPIFEFLAPIGNLILDIFDGVELSVGGVLIVTARAVDKFIGLWVGAFWALNALFKKLPDLIGSFMILAVNAIVGTIENMLNRIVGGINTLFDNVGLDPIDLIDLGRMNDELVTGFGNLGDAVKDAFLDGFDQNSIESVILGLIDKAQSKARARLSVNVPKVNLNDKKDPATKQVADPFGDQLKLLEQEAKLLQLGSRERSIQSKLISITNKLKKEGVDLNEGQSKTLELTIRTNAALEEQASVLDNLNGPQEELIAQQEALIALYDRGSISLETLNDQMLQLLINQSAINIEMGQGTFSDGFIVGIESMLESVRNFGAEAGLVFADFFEQTTEGFANSIADAIIFGDSIKESIGNVARQALSELLGGLIKLGIQFVLNKVLSDQMTNSQIAGAVAVGTTQAAVQASTTASSIAASTATTSAIVADNAVIATSAAVPAALESTVTFGGAAIAGLAALAAILAFSKGFADGGFVSGPGTSRSDSIPANLSNGEFVVNARSTARFRPQLEAMNSGKGFADGGEVNDSSLSSGQVNGNSVTQPTNISMINVIDPALLDNYLSTPEGEEAIINVISNNSESVRGVLS